MSTGRYSLPPAAPAARVSSVTSRLDDRQPILAGQRAGPQASSAAAAAHAASVAMTCLLRAINVTIQ